jgi:uncharacterized membrane protein YwaF
MAKQEGFARLTRLFSWLSRGGIWCAMAGLALWFAVVLTVGRWGPAELLFVTVPPASLALASRITGWLLDGFIGE